MPMPMTSPSHAPGALDRVANKGRSLAALDVLNAALADVRDGLGPYLAIYLAAVQHWDPRKIGAAMAVLSVATVIAQTPAGGLVDAIRRKRLIIVGAALGVSMGAVAMAIWPVFGVIVAAQAVIGGSSAIFPPALAAISLGLVGHARLARRTGRNEAFNHAGNVAAACLAAVIGDKIAYVGIFYQVAVMGLITIVAALAIRERDIDHGLAGGESESETPARNRRRCGSACSCGIDAS